MSNLFPHRAAVSPPECSVQLVAADCSVPHTGLYGAEAAREHLLGNTH